MTKELLRKLVDQLDDGKDIQLFQTADDNSSAYALNVVYRVTDRDLKESKS